MDIYRQTVCGRTPCGGIGKLYLPDKPRVFIFSFQCLAYSIGEFSGIETSVKKTVYVGRLVCSCQQVVHLPH